MGVLGEPYLTKPLTQGLYLTKPLIKKWSGSMCPAPLESQKRPKGGQHDIRIEAKKDNNSKSRFVKNQRVV